MKNTGITLIVLIITIIVLLILAGVAISMLAGGIAGVAWNAIENCINKGIVILKLQEKSCNFVIYIVK